MDSAKFKVEGEYIKNLQQQIYFLELEANFLYPLPEENNGDSALCIMDTS